LVESFIKNFHIITNEKEMMEVMNGEKEIMVIYSGGKVLKHLFISNIKLF
jgi:hypothetical protein